MRSEKYLVDLGIHEYIKIHKEEYVAGRVAFCYVAHNGSLIELGNSSNGVISEFDMDVLNGLQPKRFFPRGFLHNPKGYTILHPLKSRAPQFYGILEGHHNGVLTARELNQAMSNKAIRSTHPSAPIHDSKLQHQLMLTAYRFGIQSYKRNPVDGVSLEAGLQSVMAEVIESVSSQVSPFASLFKPADDQKKDVQNNEKKEDSAASSAYAPSPAPSGSEPDWI